VRISDIGEFRLIERLTEKLGVPASDALVVGIGDDGAVWRAGERAVIATTDTMVEGVHYLPDVTPWCDLGWKALAVNVSDIAAMGGRPAFGLVTLALPPQTEVGSIDELYAGLQQCAEAYGVTIAGGDVVRAPQVSITVALTGEAVVDGGYVRLLRRDGAHAGDVIAVTGTLGNSAAGLRRLKEGAPSSDPLAQAHLRPQPRVNAGLLAIDAGLTCGIDVSDGLLQDVGHICEMSGVSAAIRAQDVPMSDGLRAAYPDDALVLACTGGEDYELVLVGPRERMRALDVTVIGEIVSRRDPRVALVDESGEAIEIGDAGWDHLRE
jgi:thiamine-monophosphate kinase